MIIYAPCEIFLWFIQNITNVFAYIEEGRYAHNQTLSSINNTDGSYAGQDQQVQSHLAKATAGLVTPTKHLV